MYLNYRIFLVLLLFSLFACKEKKKQMLDTEKVELADFIEFFPDMKLPYQLADSGLVRKSPDSLRIGNKIFAQFVPDSVVRAVFGKTAKPKLYPLGKSVVKDGETYLFVKAELGSRRAGYILVFADEKFITSMPAVVINGTPKSNDQSVVNFDSRYTITTLRQKTAGDGQVTYSKKVYVYNTAGVFTLILTESNDQEAAKARIINPIDTLPSTHKLTGDYLQGTRNIVSFRNGKSSGSLYFFIHFEKDGGECRGELKGEARLTGSNSARFTEGNGPCVIDFTFSGNTVKMKEVEGCGSYRDIKCFFEGSFTRKKKTTAPARKKK